MSQAPKGRDAYQALWTPERMAEWCEKNGQRRTARTKGPATQDASRARTEAKSQVDAGESLLDEVLRKAREHRDRVARAEKARRDWQAEMMMRIFAGAHPYEALGLSVHDAASDEAINAAFRRVALTCHPDHGGSGVDFGDLTEAYRFAREWAPKLRGEEPS